MFERQRPSYRMKYWVIPFLANICLWALTVCSAILYMTYNDYSLALGPLSEYAKENIDALVDKRTVFFPIIIASGVVVISCVLSIRLPKESKGRFNKRHLRNQFFAELRSFSLSAWSLSFSVFWFTQSWPLFTIAVICLTLWVLLNSLYLASEAHIS